MIGSHLNMSYTNDVYLLSFPVFSLMMVFAYSVRSVSHSSRCVTLVALSVRVVVTADCTTISRSKRFTTRQEDWSQHITVVVFRDVCFASKAHTQKIWLSTRFAASFPDPVREITGLRPSLVVIIYHILSVVLRERNE